MDSQKELVIFRIIQEALNNIIKHSNATYAKVELNYLPSKLMIKISDNGKGFNVHHVKGSEHAGLKNMRARTMMLNGFMDVKSFPGAATTLLFTIPFEPYGEN
jgi:signal transduction histidine kinase